MKKLLVLIAFIGLSCTHCFAIDFQMEVYHHPKTGEVAMKTGKMMVFKDGQWVQMEEEQTMRDGTRVKKDGTVVLKNGTSRKLFEGECVHLDGTIKAEQPEADSKETEKKMNEILEK